MNIIISDNDNNDSDKVEVKTNDPRTSNPTIGSCRILQETPYNSTHSDRNPTTSGRILSDSLGSDSDRKLSDVGSSGGARGGLSPPETSLSPPWKFLVLIFWDSFLITEMKSNTILKKFFVLKSIFNAKPFLMHFSFQMKTGWCQVHFWMLFEW
jgi:hypothetical protein